MVGWYVGAGINLVGSVAINLGTNVMKLGHNRRANLDMPEAEKPPVTRFREWQIGTGVFIMGNIANFVSFGYAAQSLLAALGSVQFVSNVVFASFVLKEKITFLVLIATACIIGGCMLLVIFGNHSSDDYNVHQLLDLYKKPAYIVYLVMMFVFVFGSYILYLHGKNVAGQKGREKSIWVALLPVSYSIFAALLGTQSVLFSKSVSVLLRATFSGDSQLDNWYTWVTLLCFVLAAGFWVTRLNKALRLFPAMIIVPLMQICWTLFSIISGMIYFQEYMSFNPATARNGPLNAIMFSVGVLVVFIGVFLLTKSGHSNPAEEHKEEDTAKAGDGAGIELAANPAFEEDSHGASGAMELGGGHDLPPKNKVGLDTLRFTSLATNTVSFNKTMTKHPVKRSMGATSPGPRTSTDSPGFSPVHHGPDSMNGSMRPDGGQRTRGSLITIDSEGEEQEAQQMESPQAEGSMMGTLKKGAKKTYRRLKADFNVDPEDFKQIFGLGKGNAYMPAMSMFTMPGVDLVSSSRSQQAQKRGERGESTERVKESLFSALPQSRFFDRQVDAEAGPLRASCVDLDRQSAPLLSGPRSTDPAASGHSSSSMQDDLQGHRSNSCGSGSRPWEQQGTLQDIVSKTVKQVEEVAARARDSVEAKLARIKQEQALAYRSLQDKEDMEAQTPLPLAPGAAHSPLTQPLRSQESTSANS